MTKYIFFVCSDKTAEKYNAAEDTIDEWVSEFEGSGARKMGDPFDNSTTFRTVKIRDGKQVVTEGPSQSYEEAIYGFDLIECRNMDEAISIAAKHPMAKFGQIEIRPLS
jgi:hypothetical protein